MEFGAQMAGLAGDAELLPRTHSEEDRQLARALALSAEDADLLAGHVDFAANPLRVGGAEALGALAAGFVSDDPGHGTRCKGVCVSRNADAVVWGAVSTPLHLR